MTLQETLLCGKRPLCTSVSAVNRRGQPENGEPPSWSGGRSGSSAWDSNSTDKCNVIARVTTVLATFAIFRPSGRVVQVARIGRVSLRPGADGGFHVPYGQPYFSPGWSGLAGARERCPGRA